MLHYTFVFFLDHMLIQELTFVFLFFFSNKFHVEFRSESLFFCFVMGYMLQIHLEKQHIKEYIIIIISGYIYGWIGMRWCSQPEEKCCIGFFNLCFIEQFNKKTLKI